MISYFASVAGRGTTVIIIRYKHSVWTKSVRQFLKWNLSTAGKVISKVFLLLHNNAQSCGYDTKIWTSPYAIALQIKLILSTFCILNRASDSCGFGAAEGSEGAMFCDAISLPKQRVRISEPVLSSWLPAMVFCILPSVLRRGLIGVCLGIDDSLLIPRLVRAIDVVGNAMLTAFPSSYR